MHGGLSLCWLRADCFPACYVLSLKTDGLPSFGTSGRTRTGSQRAGLRTRPGFEEDTPVEKRTAPYYQQLCNIHFRHLEHPCHPFPKAFRDLIWGAFVMRQLAGHGPQRREIALFLAVPHNASADPSRWTQRRFLCRQPFLAISVGRSHWDPIDHARVTRRR